MRSVQSAAHDVFVSYPRRDRERVINVRNRLEELGFKTFFDADNIDAGAQFPSVIDRAVKSAGCVLALWNPYALTRDWVVKECRIGLERDVLVAAMIEPVAPLQIPTEFGRPQMVDLTDFNNQIDHKAFLELVRAIAKKLRRPAPKAASEEAGTLGWGGDAIVSAWKTLRKTENISAIADFGKKRARGTPVEVEVASYLTGYKSWERACKIMQRDNRVGSAYSCVVSMYGYQGERGQRASEILRLATIAANAGVPGAMHFLADYHSVQEYTDFYHRTHFSPSFDRARVKLWRERAEE